MASAPDVSVDRQDRGLAASLRENLWLSRLLPPGSLSGTLLIIVPIAIVAALVSQFMGAAEERTLTHALILIVGALAFQIYTGNSGILSFGHVAFMGLGAHVAALFTIPPAQKDMFLPDLPYAWLAQAHWGFPEAMMLAVVLVGVIGLLIGFPISRLGGAAAAIATLGLLIIAYSVIVGARDFTRGSQALIGVPRVVDVSVALAFAAIALLVARAFRDSAPGLEIRAVREDETAARAIGINVFQRRLVCWTLSAVMAAVAGVLLGHSLGVFSPKEFYFQLTFQLLVMLIVGGMTSASGAVLGVVMVTMLIEVLRTVEDTVNADVFGEPTVFGLTDVGLGVAVLAVLYRHREGMFGYFEIDERLRRAFGRGLHGAHEGPRRALEKVDPKGSLSVTDVTKTFGGLVAVDNATLSLRPGEVVGLIGPNGSGKTTLLGCVSGVLEPSSGSIEVDGEVITDWPAHSIARHRVGRTFQNIRLFANLTVLQNVTAALGGSGLRASAAETERRAMGLLAELGLGDYVDRLAGTLAYGLQRRVEIARALALSPRYLLLDEPAAGLNESESDELLDLLGQLGREQGIGLLVVDHDLRLIMRLCDRVVVLNKGQVIAEGTPEEIQNDPGVIEAYLGKRRAAATGAA